MGGIPCLPGLFLAALFFLTSACGPPPPPGAPEAGGGLNVRSNPSGARIGIDGEPTQLRTPTVLPSLAPGEHRLSLSLGGYRRWEGGVEVAAGETVNLDILLEPVATGSLSISSIPFMAWIFIDGRPTPHVTPATVTDLPVGTHTVLLRREGYEDWSHAVVVLENRQMPLKASLKPAKGMRGNLNVQTSPPRAEIVVNGYPTGNRSPATVFNLIAGSHLVELRKEGYLTWSEEVTIKEEVTSNLLVTLERSERQHWGSAVISSTPQGAEVVLDDVQLSTLTPVSFETITHGTHSLEIRKEGFSPWEGELTVRPGERTELEITLKARSVGTGRLSVESAPAGAAIRIDGKETGKTSPALLEGISAGNHLVYLEHEGFRVWSRSLYIASGETASVAARLIPRDFVIEAAVVSSAPDEIGLEVRVGREGPPADWDQEISFTVEPATFGRFSPSAAPLGGGTIRTILRRLSTGGEARLVISLGEQRAFFHLGKEEAGWRIRPEE